MPFTEEDKAGLRWGNSRDQNTAGQNVTALKKQRGVTKGKITTKVRILNDLVLQNSPVEVLDDVFSEICDLFEKIERINDHILQEADDSLQSEHLEYIGDLQKVKCDIQ